MSAELRAKPGSNMLADHRNWIGCFEWRESGIYLSRESLCELYILLFSPLGTFKFTLNSKGGSTLPKSSVLM